VGIRHFRSIELPAIILVKSQIILVVATTCGLSLLGLGLGFFSGTGWVQAVSTLKPVITIAVGQVIRNNEFINIER
jgi:hypothetical protein